MRRKKLLACLLVLVTLVIIAAPVAYAASATGSGRQIRGTGPGNDAKLISDPIMVPKGAVATIVSVECSGDGFWIDGDVYLTFGNPAAAVGVRLNPGRYYVYPSLKNGQSEARVSVTVNW